MQQTPGFIWVPQTLNSPSEAPGGNEAFRARRPATDRRSGVHPGQLTKRWFTKNIASRARSNADSRLLPVDEGTSLDTRT